MKTAVVVRILDAERLARVWPEANQSRYKQSLRNGNYLLRCRSDGEDTWLEVMTEGDFVNDDGAIELITEL